MISQIQFLITSDTHGAWPYTIDSPAPPVDVLLHCGDLTQVGGLASFKRAMSHIASVDAELKLIIAGNHDLELDEKWVRDGMEDEDELQDHFDCISFMKSHQGNGIHYLDEGTHEFVLKDGRKFSVYASPYTPEFNGYAFAYAKGEDRFNEGGNPIPDHVDVVMTHGPPLFSGQPHYTLDVNKDEFHCGCEKLALAVQRTRPRLHCFGHIHEGRGAMRLGWNSGEGLELETIEGLANNGCALSVGLEGAGRDSLLVNAAMHGEGKGWFVDMEVDCGLNKVMDGLHLRERDVE
jgi:Icc-related predicted phosphoesterase